jgi:CheY-like chemotaxis protein
LTPGKHIMLTIRDTGHGIAPGVIDKIFDPYFTTKEIGRGTGLGLSVVHGIVGIHKGYITLESEHEKGTAFIIYFPVFEEEYDIKADAVQKVPGGKERILLVDDEPDILKVMQITLRKLGYQVEAFASPSEVLSIFSIDPDEYDLVITDMTMPDMTGDKLAKELIDIRPDIPIILCTGYLERISEEYVKNIGIKNLIIKPFNKKELALKIRKVLDQA